ncbi:MAG: hypothetical protein DMF76_21885 [Acidobacteria bacterium]|nr:MAG: hypothetical protein DMF76_21885 [Acidobacteriota bacterium]
MPLHVKYFTSDSVAQQASDYTATYGKLSFAAGETSKTITIPIVDDGYQESSEAFKINLKSADVGVLGAQNTATVTITDNDAAGSKANEGVQAATNPIDATPFFVGQQFYDFLNRVPTLAEVTNSATPITQCGSDQTCIRTQRINVSNTFFNDPAFQGNGYFVYRLYKTLLGRQPNYAEFVLDRSTLIGSADLETSKANLVNAFIVRAILMDPSLNNLTAEQFVDKLNTNVGGVVTSTQRTALVNALHGKYGTLASTLRSVADNQTLVANESNAANVLMLYFGYLRHDADSLYASRLQMLNQGGTLLSLVDAFVNSTEYRARFGAQAAPSPTIQFNSASYSAGEGAGSTTVTVTRSGETSSAATVRYATSDGTAKEGKDYTAAYGVLSLATGETSKTFTVLIIDNGYVAGTRTVNLTLSNPTGATLSAQSTAALNITENDTLTTNPVDQARFFVQQHYYDFLGRYPDQGGWDFWTNEIASCGTNQSCIDLKRINVSAAYFLSIEFQQTGYLVERIYKTAYGNGSGASTFGGTHQFAVPIVRFNEFLPDTQQIGSGVVVGATGWETVLENNKQAFTNDCVQRSRFTTAFPTTMSPAQFVDKLNTNAGNVLLSSERAAAIALFGSATDTSNTSARAQALRQVSENATLNSQEFNRALVLMQFFGYLRRDPNSGQDTDYTGFDFWLTKLNQFNGNFVNAEMVKAFITSTEYRQRFGAN